MRRGDLSAGLGMRGCAGWGWPGSAQTSEVAKHAVLHLLAGAWRGTGMVGGWQGLLLKLGLAFPAAPSGVCGGGLRKLLRGEVALAEQQQDGAMELPPSLRHAHLKRCGGGLRWAPPHGAQAAAERPQGLPADAAGQEFAPEGGHQQALAVIVFDLVAGQPGFGANPGVEQGEARHAWVCGGFPIQQAGRRAVAQAPEHHALHAGAGRLECTDSDFDMWGAVFHSPVFGSVVVSAFEKRVNGLSSVS
jgi:hypothetical protein